VEKWGEAYQLEMETLVMSKIDLKQERELVKTYINKACLIHPNVLGPSNNEQENKEILEIAKMLQMAHRWGQFKEGKDDKKK